LGSAAGNAADLFLVVVAIGFAVSRGQLRLTFFVCDFRGDWLLGPGGGAVCR
jgi:hypothetical protein